MELQVRSRPAFASASDAPPHGAQRSSTGCLRTLRHSAPALVTLLFALVTMGTGPLDAQETGIAAGYPEDRGIQQHPSVLLALDFNDEDQVLHWLDGKPGYAWTDETAHVRSGSGSLEIQQSKGTHQPSEIHPSLPATDVAFVRFYRKYESGYDFTQHKMPGVYAYAQGRTGGGAGEVPTGFDKFSCKLFVTFDGYPRFYTYHPEQKGPWGDALPMNLVEEFALETDRWYCFEMMIRANEPGQRDGELMMWIDGRRVAHYEDMRFRDTQDLAINLFTHSAYVGGSWVSKRDQRLWDDQIVVATEYIGPMSRLAHPTPLETHVMSEPVMIGGLGGLYLLAEPGELVIDLHKSDRHDEGTKTDLRAILLGPDRRPLDEVTIQGDGTAQLTTHVEHAGVYVVNVTAAFDRYGEQVWWGFSTNCSKYLVETPRGHKDALHMEPIVPADPDEAFDVFFLPRQGEITLDVTGPLATGGSPDFAELYNESGGQLATLDLTPEGTLSFTIQDLPHESREPWRLHLPRGATEIQIDGVTRWDRGEPFDDLSLWSPDRDSFFPFHDLRWVLTPYAHVAHAEPGAQYDVRLRVHNNGANPDTMHLAVATDGNDELRVALSQDVVELSPGESAVVIATVSVPEAMDPTSDSDATGPVDTLDTRIVVSSARHPQFRTWSRLETRIGTVTPTAIDVPIVYRPYEHESAQFGYTPDYPNANQIYFDPENGAWIRGNDGLHQLVDGTWQWVDTVEGTRFRAGGSKVAFGGQGEICVLGPSDSGPAYLYSPDGGITFHVGAGDVPTTPMQTDIEQFAGHNLPVGPAPFVVARQTGGADPEHFWRRVNDFELYLPTFTAGQLDLGNPIPVSQQAIGIAAHSGVPSAIASMGDRVHVIWGEATDPSVDVPGVPAYVATYDRSEGRWLGEPALVGYGPPANDVHNTPSLVIDSEGYLHTLTGTHGSPFAYARSLEPNTAHEGFTEPTLIEEGLRSTYVGLVCDPDDTLHLVFRAWTTDGVYHPHSQYANLGYKRKLKGSDWEPMRRLAVAPFSEYSIWYHRLTIDRRGRLFVSFDIWSTFWFYRTDHVGSRRKTIMSSDGGDSWQLLQTADLAH